MKYACIRQYREVYPVRLMCRALDVSPAGYYAAQQRTTRGPTARAQRDAVLGVHVRAAHAASHGTYGAPRIHAELQAQGLRVAKKRVARLLGEGGLVARRPRRRVRTTDARHREPLAPNRLERSFAPAPLGAPPAAVLDCVWVSDVTYVRTREGWLYLAAVLDLASRRVVGWALDATLDASLPCAALRRALAARRPRPGLVHHSDRGAQYAGAAYRALLAEAGAVASMSRKGDCWDNAVVESFFSTLKSELLPRRPLPTQAEARTAIAQYIEGWYNPRRRHSTLGYLSPIAFERALTQSHSEAA